MSNTIGTGIPNAYPMAINSPLDRAYLRPLKQPLFDSEYVVTGNNRCDFFQRQLGQSFRAFITGIPSTKFQSDTNMCQAGQLDYPREFSILGFSLMLEEGCEDRDRANIYNDGCINFGFPGRARYLNLPLIRMPRNDNHTAFQVFVATTNEFNRRNIPEPEEESDVNEPSPEGDDDLVEDIATLIQMAKQGRYVEETATPVNTPPVAQRAGAILNPMSTPEFQAWSKAFKKISVERCPYYNFTIGKTALKIRSGESFQLGLEWSRPLTLSKPVKLYAFIEGLMWQPLAGPGPQ